MKDANFSEQFERLLTATHSRTDRALAQALGISFQSVSQARTKQKIPPQWFIDVSIKYRCSVDWLVMGKGPMFTTEEVEKIPARAGILRAGDPIATYRAEEVAEKVVNSRATEAIDAPSHQIVMIPMVEARLSAGHGSFETDDTIERKYSFRSDFLRRKGSVSEMVLMRVEGDSMSPAIENGDVVLLDQSQKAPRAGGIYAVGVEDVVYLKRINATPGKLVMSSYNPEYPPIEVDARGDLADGIRIIGRMIWSCREW